MSQRPVSCPGCTYSGQPHLENCESKMRDFGHTLAEIKVASIVVHVQEFLSFDGREADRNALLSLLNDPDVIAWLKNFPSVLLPVKRVK